MKINLNSDEPQTFEKEPIAIIGIGCRFPGGVDSPEAFWKLLRNGTDAITEVPKERWNLCSFYDQEWEKPGKICTRYGGFIEKIDEFDADFFGIFPKEAKRIDPQQRILLEVAYEALEDGGQVPERLAGKKTGVFIGISFNDYLSTQLSVSDRDSVNAYTNLGGMMCIAANRISYTFNFTGPSLTVDTACSSSLVAVHLAIQSIWNGESTMALAGGVNAILNPELTIGFSKALILSPDGRCKSFDAGANGYVRAEGAGIVVLKPLSRALADSDPIYAVIRGSAVNSDGHTNNGIMFPSGQAQEAMLREAYRQAGILPEQVQYIEAHGTGTSVSDPIEAIAIGNVVGRGRQQGSDCVIGSVKTNIGHLEPASGIASLIKTALMLKHKQIPPNLHFVTPNPKIPFESLRLRVPQTLESWTSNGQEPRIAGVNSFGFGGTNAHVVLLDVETKHGCSGHSLHSPPPEIKPQDQTSSDGQALLLPLSAKSPEALQAVAKVTYNFLSSSARANVSLLDICYTASLRRGHHEERLAVVADCFDGMAESLSAFLAGETYLGLSSGYGYLDPDTVPKVAFVFSGMGQQCWGMGRQLLECEPVFQEIIKRCDKILQHYAEWSLWDELLAPEENSRINETQIAQCCIFSVQVALCALWHSWGIIPSAIVGYSVGEVAAAHVAGVLSLEDALKVIFHRSRLQATTVGEGKMLTLRLPLEEAEGLLVGYENRVSIAAINSPTSLTLSGDTHVLDEISAILEQKEIFCRFLQLEVPYHSLLMEPLKAELAKSLQGIQPQLPTIPLFSTVTGQQVTGTEMDAHYWIQNMKESVLFASAVDGLIEAGYDQFLEIGAHPVLANYICDCFAPYKQTITVLPSLQHQEPERAMMLLSLSKLYTLGYLVDWNQLYQGRGQFVKLPSYPWQRERYWNESSFSQQARQGQTFTFAMPSAQIHPLLGSQLKLAQPVWDGLIDKQILTYLNDYRIQGVPVYPTAAYVEMVLAALKVIFKEEACIISEIKFQKALILSDNGRPTLQLIIDPTQTSFDIYSTGDTEESWVRNATGKLNRNQNDSVPNPFVLDEYKSLCPREIAKREIYGSFQAMGLEYGFCFQAIEQFFWGDKQSLSQIRLNPTLKTQIEEYQLHPTILDACFQVLLFMSVVSGNQASLYQAVEINQLRIYARGGTEFWCYARLVEESATSFKGDAQLLDRDGNVLAEVQGLRFQSLEEVQKTTPEKIDNVDIHIHNSEEKHSHKALMSAPPTERQQLLEIHITEQVARIMGICAHRINIQHSLMKLGLGSLMAVEISNWLKSKLGVNVTTMNIMQGLSISLLAKRSLEQLALESIKLSISAAIENSEEEEEITL